MRRRPRRGATLDEIEAVYRERASAFERVAIAIVEDEQTGCDAVHDGFVHAVRHRKRYRGDGPIAAWLWRIVVNEARKRRAERARLVAVDPADLENEPTRNGDEPTHRARALVAALPERQRLALFLRYYADLDYAGIADALDIKPGTVAATLNAAHTALRKHLEEVPR